MTERLLQCSVALGILGCTCVCASTAGRATLHLSELPPGQHHPTCQPWALSACLQVLLSAITDTWDCQWGAPPFPLPARVSLDVPPALLIVGWLLGWAGRGALCL